MLISQHADNSEKKVGIRGEDIHRWIDGFFDYENFEDFLTSENFKGQSPYEHRKFRHCKEALADAYEEFEGRYTKNEIKGVFESHLMDDYQGYIPSRADFLDGTFKEKYHLIEDELPEENILTEEELSEYFKGKADTLKQKHQKKITTGFNLRLVFPTLLAIIMFLISIFTVIIPIFRENMIEDKKEMIKQLTNSAISVIKYHQEEAKQGLVSEERAKEEAAETISKMRYGVENKDYFWITDMDPKMIMHPYRSELKGKDLTDYKDINNKSGKYLFVEFVKLVKSESEGYLEYLWQWKDENYRVVPKLSFVKGVPEWNWIIGTGIYIHDVEEEISLLSEHLTFILFLIAIVLIIFLIYVLWQSTILNKELVHSEMKLNDAKDRYKALVRVSNEGHILIIKNKVVYVNDSFKKMLGYDAVDFIQIKLTDILTQSKSNKTAYSHFEKLDDGESTSKVFEAQVVGKSKNIVEVTISISRIFLSNKNGHIITIRKVTHKKVGSALNYNFGSLKDQKALFGYQKVVQVYRKSSKLEKDYIFPDQTISLEGSIHDVLAKLNSIKTDQLSVVDEDEKVVGVIGYYEIASMFSSLPAGILYEIENSYSVGNIIQTLNRLPDLITQMINQGARSDTIRDIISKMYEVSVKKFITFSLEEMGEPPVPFTFISLGSVARKEMTLFSDQDNALLFDNVSEDHLDKVRKYFLNLADHICTKLNDAGYPFCPGGIMSVNPKYCLSLDEWKNSFRTWIDNANPESILEINVFFDLSRTYGDENLLDQLTTFIFNYIEDKPHFFIQFAKNCLMYKEPLSLLGKIKTDNVEGSRRINIKENLIPIVNFARIYALKNRITKPGTIERILELEKLQMISTKQAKEIIYLFNHIWYLRFFSQIDSHSQLRKINEELNIEDLTDIERLNLKNVLSVIPNFQKKLSSDFLDGMSV